MESGNNTETVAWSFGYRMGERLILIVAASIFVAFVLLAWNVTPVNYCIGFVILTTQSIFSLRYQKIEVDNVNIYIYERLMFKEWKTFQVRRDDFIGCEVNSDFFKPWHGNDPLPWWVAFKKISTGEQFVLLTGGLWGRKKLERLLVSIEERKVQNAPSPAANEAPK